MLDVPYSVGVIALVVGMAAGALGVFVVLDPKVQRLQASCRRYSDALLEARWEATVLRECPDDTLVDTEAVIDTDALFQVQAAPGAVILIVDPRIAVALAGTLERAYTSGELSTADRPLWLWDIAELRRAAVTADQEAADVQHVDVAFVPEPFLQHVAGGGES